MALQQAGIPDNVAYLVLGVIILALFLGGWLASFLWRLRNLRREMALLQRLEAEDIAAPGQLSTAETPSRHARPT
ncbi:MAG: hypothetical protein HPY64_03710 [Anaerolineae bacterium]|nr:hypothetical protein [Anaerolineae bacterium]